MNFFDHLQELRTRLFYCLIFFFLMFILSSFFIESLIHFLLQPTLLFIKNHDLITLHLLDQVLIYFKMSAGFAFIFSIPFILWQLFLFVIPALSKKEKFILYGATILSSFFFILGLFLGFYLILPLMLKIFLSFQLFEGTHFFSLKEHLFLTLKILFLSGLLMISPLILIILDFFNDFFLNFIKKYHGPIIIGLAIFSALITPSDLLSLLLLWIPLVLLFEFSIFLITLRRKFFPR